MPKFVTAFLILLAALLSYVTIIEQDSDIQVAAKEGHQATISKTAPHHQRNPIDIAIGAELAQRGLSPAPRCDDATFARRVTLILTGQLPSWQQAEAFAKSKSPSKREQLIDQLLASPDYIDYQVLKWGDLLRVKSEFPSNIWPNGVQAYNRWIREQMMVNRPYEEMVYELLVSTGSNFRSPAVNFYRAFQNRAPQQIADNINLLFLGSRNSNSSFAPFFEQLRYKGSREWKEEIVYADLDIICSNSLIQMPDGQQIKLRAGQDARRNFAVWLVGERAKGDAKARINHPFASCMSNRIWYWLMGRGIVHPVDDRHQDNPASNPELLSLLEQHFVSSGYDSKALMRLILTSEAFSRSSLYPAKPAEKASAAAQFAYYPTTRLTAEQLIDAIAEISGIFDRYISMVPEPYSYFPDGIRSSQLGDGSVSSPALELFGRPSRDSSMESERDNSINSKQVLYLLNSASILDKLKRSQRIAAMVKEAGSRPELIRRIYLMMLGRNPRDREIERISPLLAPIEEDGAMAQQLIWALLNSPEFLFNH